MLLVDVTIVNVALPDNTRLTPHDATSALSATLLIAGLAGIAAGLLALTLLRSTPMPSPQPHPRTS